MVIFDNTKSSLLIPNGWGNMDIPTPLIDVKDDNE